MTAEGDDERIGSELFSMKVWGASVQGLILHTEEARVRLLARNAQRIEMQDEDNLGEFEGSESGTWR